MTIFTRLFALIATLLIGFPGMALAHASEGGFVLLLPTTLYIAGGVLSVVLTVLLVLVLPERASLRLFLPLPLMHIRSVGIPVLTSTVAFIFLMILIWTGLVGSHDPKHNLLPLTVWSIWWISFVVLQGVFGDLWRWLNPWMGPYFIVRKLLGLQPIARLPVWLGHWPALLGFLAFAAVLLAHPAPSDPEGLAIMVAGYWLIQFIAMLIFGPKWLRRGEGLSVLLNNYARVGLLAKRGGRLRIGVPGWQNIRRPATSVSLAIFMIVMLGVGSFDGLNETFWWFGKIGINPLQFPGRSAVITENLSGLILANLLLVPTFALAVYCGVLLAGERSSFKRAFLTFAPAILPIALGYHFGHYLPGFLVDAQYTLKAASDPLDNGADLLGLGRFYVTTGFFNTQATVRAIWLTQAGAVVIGHVLAILLSHALALQLYGTHNKAIRSQIPLATFMVLYTFFGLWLLASPRGV